MSLMNVRVRFSAAIAAVALAAFGGGWSLIAQGGPPAAPAQAAGNQGPSGQGPGGRGGRGPGPGGSNEAADFSQKAKIVPKTAAEETKTFILPPGYRMELVASDPDIVMPTVIEFDGNGRMYVGEM